MGLSKKEIYEKLARKEIDVEHAMSLLDIINTNADKNQNTRKDKDKDNNKLFVDDLTFYLNEYLQQKVASILGVANQQVSLSDNFMEMGVDSTNLISISQNIETEIGIELYPTLFFEYQNISELVIYFNNEYKNSFKDYFKLKNVTVRSKQKKVLPKIRTEINQKVNKASTKVSEIVDNFDSISKVAIIGINGRMPQAENLDVFWNNLINNKDCITEIPKSRWNWKNYYGDPNYDLNKTNVKWGGFIDDIDKFDADFFNISPREAELMDPQHRIFIESVWKTIEDAGYKPSALSGQSIGVFVGVGSYNYAELLNEHNVPIQAYTSTGNAFSVIANRISFLFNFIGPSEPIDTACSSALVAIHRAVNMLRLGECKLAIAGGVNALLHPKLFISFNKAGMLSVDGRCKTFSKDANGYVRGEGVGTVLLKPLEQAKMDGDHVYAVVIGSAENHGGHSNSLTAPNPNSQAELIKRAIRNANIDSTTISFIEAHGTGTSLGDPVEISGLIKAFSDLSSNMTNESKPQYCGISSVKTNIGHLETAAGIAGILKIVLSLKNKMLPANLHFSNINPYIKLKNTPFYIVQQNREWKSLKDANGKDIPRRAGISSFGFGGSNAHIILEESIRKNKEHKPSNEYLIILSAKTKNKLIEIVKQLYNWLIINKNIYYLSDIEFTLQTGREEFEERFAVLVTNYNDLISDLKNYTITGDAPNISFSSVKQILSISEFTDGEKDNLYLKEILKKRNLTSIMKLWLSGVAINWEDLANSEGCERISIPTYPFEKIRHWFQSNLITERKEQFYNMEHPFVEKNISTFYEQKYVTKLRPNEYYIKDHEINGMKILPGVFQLELIRACCRFALPDMKVIGFKDVNWLNPVIVGTDQVELESFLLTEDGNVYFEIFSQFTKDIHSRGQIVIADNDLQMQKKNIDDILNVTKKDYYKKEIYDRFCKMRMCYGDTFQRIKILHCLENEAVAELDIEDFPEKKDKRIELVPTIFDAGLQAVIGVSGDLDGENENPAFPFSIEKINFYKSICDCIYVNVISTGPVGTGQSEYKKYNIYYIGVNGDVLISIIGFCTKKAKKIISSSKEKSESTNKLVNVLTKVANKEIDVEYAMQLVEEQNG